MAEFLEVMKQKKRMCKKYTGGGICQSIDYNICPLKGHDLCCKPLTDMDINKIQEGEAIIMKWAAEHPEPVYPTWREWLEEQRVVVHFDSVNEKGKKVKWELTNKSNCPIPADIAEKLGIEPKEG